MNQLPIDNAAKNIILLEFACDALREQLGRRLSVFAALLVVVALHQHQSRGG